jgi:hypothetical protein
MSGSISPPKSSPPPTKRHPVHNVPLKFVQEEAILTVHLEATEAIVTTTEGETTVVVIRKVLRENIDLAMLVWDEALQRPKLLPFDRLPYLTVLTLTFRLWRDDWCSTT